MCPCSNLQTDAAPRVGEVGKPQPTEPTADHWARTYREHPIELLRSLEFAVTVNPDNRLMSRTSMTHEFLKLAEEFGYEREDFLEITLNAANATFLPLEEQDEIVERVMAGYSDAPVVG